MANIAKNLNEVREDLKSHKYNYMNNHGLTLIEMIVYIALVGLVGASIVPFSLLLNGSKNRNFAMSEVNDNARFVIDLIARKIREADSVIYPEQGESGPLLILISGDGTKTDFLALDRRLSINENGKTTPITAEGIIVVDLNFTRLDQDSIRISASLSRGQERNKEDYYKIELTTAVTPR